MLRFTTGRILLKGDNIVSGLSYLLITPDEFNLTIYTLADSNTAGSLTCQFSSFARNSF